MSGWNVPEPGPGGQILPFPEEYLRNYINDKGSVEGSVGIYGLALQNIVDRFTSDVGQYQFTLTQRPSGFYPPFVYRNGVFQYLNVDYITDGNKTITFAQNVMQTGDLIQVDYAF